MRSALAGDLGCEIGAFATNALTIVSRPEPQVRHPAVALIVTFGTGTVVSVEPAYREFVEAHAPEQHYRALYEALLRPLVEEGERRGDPLTARYPNLGFTLARRRRVVVPEGYRLVAEGRPFADAHLPGGQFQNALSEPSRPEGLDQFSDALVLYDAAGEPAAVAGAFRDAPGLLEIGLDVARNHRGRGLATVVVRAMAADILRRGLVPTYFCGATNVRSHRTALASGFLPALSSAVVRREAAAARS